jgi:6-pyruvoyl-tetrahydropterin synthase
MELAFKKAVKTKSRLRLAIDGISGSGKTYTALAIASGMGGAIALIDSEHGSASLYADKFAFDTLDITEFQIENYIEALKAAAIANYPVVIIDSTSHAWDALVERVDRIANTLTGGNASFRAWAQGTPLQKQLIEALLSYPGHVIVTCRSKTEYSIDKDEKGKTTINKVGLAAVQRAGFEYEFTMAMTMDANHVGHVTKDRTSKFQDKFITKPGKEFGQQLIAWLNEGAEMPPPPPKTQEEEYKEIMKELLNVLNSEELDERIFSLHEKDEVENKIKKKFGEIPASRRDLKIAYVKDVLEEQKKILHKRLNPNQESEETPEKTEIPPVLDDGFVDDIPGDVSKKKKKSAETKTADTTVANSDMDIF